MSKGQEEISEENRVRRRGVVTKETNVLIEIPALEIRKISGGFAGRGESSSSPKAYISKARVEEAFKVERPRKIPKRDSCPVTSTEKDIEGVLYRHNYPLVVTMIVANNTM